MNEIIIKQLNTNTYEIFTNKSIGTIKTYTNKFHKKHSYLKIDLKEFDTQIAKELFDNLNKLIKKPLQVMTSSDNKNLIKFLLAGNFQLKRKSYELEVSKKDLLKINKEKLQKDKNNSINNNIRICKKGDKNYQLCCDLLYSYYKSTHKAISPLTASSKEFVKELPKTVYYQIQNNKIENSAFIENNEIAYLSSNNSESFNSFLLLLVNSLFQKHKIICFEADDCDYLAMDLVKLFKTDEEINHLESYNTYLLQI